MPRPDVLGPRPREASLASRRFQGVLAQPVNSALGDLGAQAWANVWGRTNLLLDLALLALSLLVSSELSRADGTVKAATFWLVGSLAAFWTLAATLIHHYDLARKRAVVDDIAIVSLLVLGVGSVIALLNLLGLGPPHGASPALARFLMIFWPTALGLRLFRNRGRYRHEHEPALEEVVIVGTGPLARAAAEDLAQSESVRLIGFLPLPGERPTKIRGPRVFDSAMSLEQVLREHPVTEVYLTAGALESGDALQSAIQTCERFGVRFAMPACRFRLDRAEATNLKEGSLGGFVHYSGVRPRVVQLALKRLLDIFVSATALLILSPLLIGVAILVKVTSRGPVFFRQTRSGLNGATFGMLKFRSMVVDADEMKARMSALNEQSGPVFKIRRDPRVTLVGRFLRKHSIDELPQLLNVLRGDMSLVGPRPPVPEEVRKYEAWQRRRLSVRPGLTCVWQVSGRNELSFDQWMYLDMQYIDNWKITDDLGLLFRTLPVVLTGRGAS